MRFCPIWKIDCGYAEAPLNSNYEGTEFIPILAHVYPFASELVKEIPFYLFGEINYHYFQPVKKVDKLKRQRYEISIRILDLDTKSIAGKLHKKEENELVILRKKEKELDYKIDNS